MYVCVCVRELQCVPITKAMQEMQKTQKTTANGVENKEKKQKITEGIDNNT